MSSDAVVHAVVVTFNRKHLLVACLESLAAQSHPLASVLVVDNASTDGTLEHLAASGIAARLPVDVLRLERNGGASEGFHYAIRHARERVGDWLFVMDDDCVAPPDCLAALLAHPRAADPGAAVLAPLVRSPDGAVLPLNRGWLRPRWFLGPLVPTGPEHERLAEVEVEHCAFVGMLVRREAARAVDPPRRELFIWWDDLEWGSRLRAAGAMWLLPQVSFTHADARPMPDVGLRARLSDFRRGETFAASWKRTYGLRNLLFCGRRDGYLDRPRAAAFTLVALVRALLLDAHRLRGLRLTLAYARDGRRGVFRNVAPERWPELAEHPRPRAFLDEVALRYDRDTDGAGPRPLADLARLGT